MSSKWKDRILGLIVVEPCSATASFKEWGEAKVQYTSNHDMDKTS
jgi:hypothetical protein